MSPRARERGSEHNRGPRVDQGRLPVVGPGLEQAKHAEEGADPVGDLEEVLGLERDHVTPLLYERGLVGPVGVEAGIGRAGEEDRHLRLGQLRGCAHQALPLLEEGRVSGRPHPSERVHRHGEAHIQRLVLALGADHGLLPAPKRSRQREGERANEDVRVHAHTHHDAAPVHQDHGRSHGRSHQQDLRAP